MVNDVTSCNEVFLKGVKNMFLKFLFLEYDSSKNNALSKTLTQRKITSHGVTQESKLFCRENIIYLGKFANGILSIALRLKVVHKKPLWLVKFPQVAK